LKAKPFSSVDPSALRADGKKTPVPELQLTPFLPPLPLLSPKVAFRCKTSGHMERRSFSSPPKDSDCMTNHVHHHPPNPTQNLQTTASLE